MQANPKRMTTDRKLIQVEGWWLPCKTLRLERQSTSQDLRLVVDSCVLSAHTNTSFYGYKLAVYMLELLKLVR